ncbi:hypothetical protein EYZ00_19270 [Hafnia paralvei]|nr:hypothetical protein EYZ00_19270 [Hafnia paralvei]
MVSALARFYPRRHLRYGLVSPIQGAPNSVTTSLSCRLSLPRLKQLKKQRQRTKDKGQRTKDKGQRTKDKTILFCLFVLDEMHDRTAIREDGGRLRANRMCAPRPVGQATR